MMPDSFDLLQEFVEPQHKNTRREAPVKKSNRAKPKQGRVDISHWGSHVKRVDDVLDPKYGPWEIVYAVWQGTDVPVAVDPELAELIGREDVRLSLSPSRQTGLMYVRGRFPTPGSKRRVRQSLHRYVCGLPARTAAVEMHVNHKTRLTLDNRRKHLEVVIPAINLSERSTVGTGASKYCGVSIYRGKFLGIKNNQKVYGNTSKPYRVICWFGGKRTNVGLFATEEEAARAHDTMVLRKLRSSQRMMRLVGTILPFEQVNRLLNFERSVEELKKYFHAAMKRARANAPRKSAAFKKLERIVAADEADAIPF